MFTSTNLAHGIQIVDSRHLFLIISGQQGRKCTSTSIAVIINSPRRLTEFDDFGFVVGVSEAGRVRSLLRHEPRPPKRRKHASTASCWASFRDDTRHTHVCCPHEVNVGRSSDLRRQHLHTHTHTHTIFPTVHYIKFPGLFGICNHHSSPSSPPGAAM